VLFSTGWIVTAQLFEKDGRRWVSPPSRSYKGRDGNTTYQWLVEFSSPHAQDTFQCDVLTALANYMDIESAEATNNSTAPNVEKCGDGRSFER
jgi:hypothetical protein